MDLTNLANTGMSGPAIERLSSSVAKYGAQLSIQYSQLESRLKPLLECPALPVIAPDRSDAHIPESDESAFIDDALSATESAVADDQVLLLMEIRDLFRSLLGPLGETQPPPLMAAEGAPARTPPTPSAQRKPTEPSRVVTLAYAAKHWFRCPPSTLARDIKRGVWACNRLSRQRFQFELSEIISVTPESEDDALGICPDRGESN